MLLIQRVLDPSIRPSRPSSFWDDSVAAHPAVHPPSAQRWLSPEPHFGIPAGPLLSHNALKQLGVTIPIWKMWTSSGVPACYARTLQGDLREVDKQKGTVAPVALGWLQVQRLL